MSQNYPNPVARPSQQALQRSNLYRQCLILARANSATPGRSGHRPPAGRLLRGPWRTPGAA